MKNMTIGKKIAAGFGLVIMLAVILGGIGVWKSTQVATCVADLGETHLPLAILGGKLADVASDQELAAMLFVIHGEDRFVKDFHRLDQVEDQNFEKTMKHVNADPDLVNAGWPALIDDAAGLHDHFVKAGLALIDAAKSKDQALIGKAADDLEAASKKFVASLEKFGKVNITEANRVANNAGHQSSVAKALMELISIVTLLVGLLLAFFITRSITKPVKRIIDGLNEGADQVASASGQVSSASQSLAEGASEQAASIEETSSSLEEMSSMTKQNADNANQADHLMKEANQVVGNANTSMRELTKSMAEISKASDETSKIIKTIDEIAFQTNLLALNAAVEAARAGEAGAGFAVVADEVRNLAMRAAEAAKNTAGLIEGTVKKVKDGGDLVDKTNEAFSAVAESAAKVGQLVGEIAAASNEQAQGIGQVNTAVVEMDKVIQQNAANAEESASASEEMNAQAEQMKVMVGELVALVGGAGNGGNVQQERVPHLAEAGIHHGRVEAPEGSNGKKTLPHQPKGASPEEVIPMDNDFKDF